MQWMNQLSQYMYILNKSIRNQYTCLDGQRLLQTSGKKKVQGIYYKEKLPGNTKELKIAQVTQNTIKVKVKI